MELTVAMIIITHAEGSYHITAFFPSGGRGWVPNSATGCVSSFIIFQRSQKIEVSVQFAD
jgi:hypothetical protein